MTFFKKVKVIKTRTVKRAVNEETSSYASLGYGHSSSSKRYELEITQVLCSVNGELKVKEFNGKWDLSDMKELER